MTYKKITGRMTGPKRRKGTPGKKWGKIGPPHSRKRKLYMEKIRNKK